MYFILRYSLSGAKFREHAETTRNYFLGDPATNVSSFVNTINIVSVTFPSTPDYPLEDSILLQSYFQAVSNQRAELSAHSSLIMTPENAISLVGANSVLMKCQLAIRSNR